MQPTPNQKPLVLDPDGGDIIQEVEDLLETMRILRAAEDTLKIRSAASRVAEMTRRTRPSSDVWAKARDSRKEYLIAKQRQWDAIRKVGRWDQIRDLWVRAARAWIAVARLYLSAVMYSCKIQGALDLTKDVAVLNAWSAA